ncbi:MAG: nitrous oxide reductase accessory protein NosL [Deltaproteobacteria bacterium]|nr:nitrous oxide reductase accessory protein NosL [Deltaproteobacteria bacterium]
MKKTLIIFLAGILVLSLTATLSASEDVKKHSACKYCGMDREKFGHSRMLIEYDDGSQVGTCSLHCAAVDLALNLDKTPKLIWVGDYGTRSLVNAEKAFWIIGGGKPGVMTKRAKWAFAEKTDAEKFIKENGGTLGDFDAALKAAYEDIADDTKMIRERRRMMRQKMMEKK